MRRDWEGAPALLFYFLAVCSLSANIGPTKSNVSVGMPTQARERNSRSRSWILAKIYVNNHAATNRCTKRPLGSRTLRLLDLQAARTLLSARTFLQLKTTSRWPNRIAFNCPKPVRYSTPRIEQPRMRAASAFVMTSPGEYLELAIFLLLNVSLIKGSVTKSRTNCSLINQKSEPSRNHNFRRPCRGRPERGRPTGGRAPDLKSILPFLASSNNLRTDKRTRPNLLASAVA